MNKEYILQYIKEMLKEMRRYNVGISKEENYQKGKVSGILEASRVLGIINKDESYDVSIEIFNEFF